MTQADIDIGYNAIPLAGVGEAIDLGDRSEAEQMTIVHRKRLKSCARYFAVGERNSFAGEQKNQRAALTHTEKYRSLAP